MNRILLEKVRCLLSNDSISKSFWVETLANTCHLVNRLPSSVIRGKTPLEVLPRKVTQDYDSLKVFGYLTYYHVKEEARERGKECSLDSRKA